MWIWRLDLIKISSSMWTTTIAPAAHRLYNDDINMYRMLELWKYEMNRENEMRKPLYMAVGLMTTSNVVGQPRETRAQHTTNFKLLTFKCCVVDAAASSNVEYMYACALVRIAAINKIPITISISDKNNRFSSVSICIIIMKDRKWGKNLSNFYMFLTVLLFLTRFDHENQFECFHRFWHVTHVADIKIENFELFWVCFCVSLYALNHSNHDACIVWGRTTETRYQDIKTNEKMKKRWTR